MSFKIFCKCGQKLKAKDEHEGKRVKCPKCGKPLLVRRPKSGAVARRQTSEWPQQSTKKAAKEPAANETADLTDLLRSESQSSDPLISDPLPAKACPANSSMVLLPTKC